AARGARAGVRCGETLADTVLVGRVGGAAGLLIAEWGVSAALGAAPVNLAGGATTTIEIDGRVLGAAFAITMLAGLFVGLIPALRGSRPGLEQTLRSAGQNVSAHRSSSMSSALVVVEVALALVLLVGAAPS